MAFSKIILNGTTLIDLTSDTVAVNNLISPNTAHNNAGVAITGTASAGADCPAFTLTWNSGFTEITAISCDKTYAECLAYIQSNPDYIKAAILIDGDVIYGMAGDKVERVNQIDYYTPGVNDGISWLRISYPQSGSITWELYPITYRSSSDLTASGATVTAPAGYYETAGTKTVASGTVTAPSTISGTSATVSTGTNTLTLSKTVSVTPNVTTAGYVSAGTAGNASVSLTASVTTQAAQTLYPSTTDQTIASGTYLTGTQTFKAVTTTNLSAENIKSGVTVTVGDSSDADRVASVTGTYSGGGGSLSYDTKTATASNYPVSLDFTGMKGQPKAFVCRLNAQVSSSGNTTYYYIVDIAAFGTTTHGNCFRIGGTRRVDNITSGYSWSYSGTTLTITSSASSRSASPGAFYSGSYELLYAY